jgi:hypothetical protein
VHRARRQPALSAAPGPATGACGADDPPATPLPAPPTPEDTRQGGEAPNRLVPQSIAAGVEAAAGLPPAGAAGDATACEAATEAAPSTTKAAAAASRHASGAAPASDAHRQLNKELCSAESCQELLALVQRRLPGFNTVNAATALYRAGKVRRYCQGYCACCTGWEEVMAQHGTRTRAPQDACATSIAHTIAQATLR